jgi:hypothetical protein
MVAVERRDDAQIGLDRLEFAEFDRSLGNPQRLEESGDLNLGETLGRVEGPFRKRPVDFTPDRRNAGPHHFCNLAVTVARRQQVEGALRSRDPRRTPRAAVGSSVGRRCGRPGMFWHRGLRCVVSSENRKYSLLSALRKEFVLGCL